MTNRDQLDTRLVETFRWYGPRDTVTLGDIRQCGCRGIISSLHDIPYGETWTPEAIRAHKNLIESAGLAWLGVESVPVSEQIKTQTGAWREHIDNYITTIRNLAAEGIDLVIYNFMPVLDWVRTDLDYELPDGKRCLLFDPIKFAAFELFILERPRAEGDYASDQLERARLYFEQLDDAGKTALERGLIDSFPGRKFGLSVDDLRQMLAAYADIDAARLKEHLATFLREVIPVCEEVGLRMAIHPDDPPFSILGLPRIVSTEADLAEIVAMIDSPSNGICFCTGSLSPRESNDLPGIVARLGRRINYTHLRNIRRLENGIFHEADHLDGVVDMFAAVSALLGECQARRDAGRGDWQLAFRPDHGHRMLDDLAKPPVENPGYTCIGRMRGLAEIRGLQLAISNSMNREGV